MDELKMPILRFKGFTETWEQSKLSDYLETSTEKNLDNCYTKQDVLSVSGDFGIVNQIEFQGRSFAGASVANYGVVHTGDVVYTKSPLSSNPFGIIKTNKGKTGIVSTLYAVYHTKKNTYPNFVQNYFEQNERLNNYLNPLVNKGAKNDMKVSNENALKGQVIFPSYGEQKVISDYFSVLDKLINLHQRKYDKIVNVRKAMLEKMFPKNGRNTPEIRFNGFTEPWEQRKLSEIADKVNEKNVNFSISETFTNSAEYGVISQRDFFDHDVSNLENLGGYYVVGEDDFVYNPRISVTAPVGPINRNKLGRKGVMSPLYTVFKTHDIDSTFLEYFFKGNGWHSYMFINGDTGARFDRFSIKNEVFFNLPIPYPQIEEQKVIGRYLGNLDNLISLHQHRIEKLRNIKLSCMEKMFV